MTNITEYCNKILDIINTYGEEYLNDPQYYIVSYDVFWKGTNRFSRNQYPFNGNIHIYKIVGEACESYRIKYLDQIRNHTLEIPLESREPYARALLERLFYIQKNHSIFHKKCFKDFILPLFILELPEIFQPLGIDLQDVLHKLQKKIGDHFCYWLKFEEADNQTKKIRKPQENFEELFNPILRKKIPDFIIRLEECKIISKGKFNHKYKNQLAKLMVYMKDNNILQYREGINAARIFYEYFGFSVTDKSDCENSVTARNIRSTFQKDIINLTEEEKSDFKLICSAFNDNT